MTNRVSVIIPSRMRENPNSVQGGLYLDLALDSVWGQRCDEFEIEMLVGIDKEHPPILERHKGPIVTFIEAGASQAEAVNRAMEKATGDLVAICEDDDLWDGNKINCQVSALRSGFDLVTCNQREYSSTKGFIRYNNFPTPSGWLMRRETWEKVGGFDETLRYHVDNDWLGRANKLGLKRGHITQEKPQDPLGWLPIVARHSEILEANTLREPLVTRTVTDDGGMSLIHDDMTALSGKFKVERRETLIMLTAQQANEAFLEWCCQFDSPAGVSMREHKILRERYGSNQATW